MVQVREDRVSEQIGGLCHSGSSLAMRGGGHKDGEDLVLVLIPERLRVEREQSSVASL